MQKDGVFEHFVSYKILLHVRYNLQDFKFLSEGTNNFIFVHLKKKVSFRINFVSIAYSRTG